jgi:hypothetical protein
MAKFEFKGREFDLTLVKEGTKLQRAVINDGGLEFPFPNYDKAAEFLTSEYGGTVEEALEVLNATESLEGLEVIGAVSQVAPKDDKKKGGKGKGSKGKGKEDKADAKKDEKKEEKAPKEPKPEPVKMTFNLPNGAVERTVQVKTILPDQKPLDTEDIKLSETVGLHINRYSDKNRTTELYKFVEGVAVETVVGKNGVNPHDVELIQNYEAVKGEVLITGVSLMDAIYKYGEVAGMTFPQADKYIKICRGLLPKPEKKNKEDKKVTAEDLKGEKKEAAAEVKEEAKEEVKSEVTAE